jgi:hypothetical protein
MIVRSACLTLLAGAVAGGLLLPGVASAQESSVPTVRLASPQTPPGGETFVTVMLNNVPTEKIQTLKTEIEYQANHLIYVAARPGFAADLAGATVEVTTRQVEPEEPPLPTAIPPPGPPPSGPPRPRTRIAITITGKKPIPNGPIAELRFKVGPAFTVTHEGVTETGDPTAKPGAPAPSPKSAPPPATPPPPATELTPPTPRTVIIRVAHRSQGAAPEGADVPLIAEAGEVRVTTERKGRVPVVFACFFYMH